MFDKQRVMNTLNWHYLLVFSQCLASKPPIGELHSRLKLTGAEIINWQCSGNGLILFPCFQLKRKEYLLSTGKKNEH